MYWAVCWWQGVFKQLTFHGHQASHQWCTEQFAGDRIGVFKPLTFHRHQTSQQWCTEQFVGDRVGMCKLWTLMNNDMRTVTTTMYYQFVGDRAGVLKPRAQVLILDWLGGYYSNIPSSSLVTTNVMVGRPSSFHALFRKATSVRRKSTKKFVSRTT